MYLHVLSPLSFQCYSSEFNFFFDQIKETLEKKTLIFPSVDDPVVSSESVSPSPHLILQSLVHHHSNSIGPCIVNHSDRLVSTKRKLSISEDVALHNRRVRFKSDVTDIQEVTPVYTRDMISSNGSFLEDVGKILNDGACPSIPKRVL